MIQIYIDGQKHVVQEGKNLLEVCLSLGYDLPYFCWHPAMGSVGSCRQCAVKQFKDENDTQGKLIMSCMEAVVDNMIISIADKEAVDFRKSIVESLMINHPHDCPVCDEGGECHLQDMTVMTGHNYRRYFFNKRTYANQYLGPLINHEMNRCIQCYRCVRFYRDYAGGRDFNVFSAHDHVYFGRHQEGVLENEFSGNLVEICPTGVFTDKTLKKHYTRKWDLTQAPSVCSHCSIGCNIIAGERYGGLRRIMSRYNHEVNGYFICDRGRFGYEFVNSERRIREVSFRDKSLKSADPIPVIDDLLKGKTIGIGSPRASLESNFMLRQVVDPEHFYAGDDSIHFRLVQKILGIMKQGSVHAPSLKEIEKADVVLIMGEDITNTAPMMALAVRQAARNKPLRRAAKLKIHEWQDSAVRELVQDEKGPVFLATTYSTRLEDVSSEDFIGNPEELADLGFMIAHKLDNSAPVIRSTTANNKESLAAMISEALKTAENPLVISGTGCMHEGLIDASYNIALALSGSNPRAMLSFVVNEVNSMGLAMLARKDLKDLFSSHDPIDTLVILENDLYRRGQKKSVDDLMKRCKHVVVLDHMLHNTASKADILLPAGTFAESQGTWVNHEGRAQRFYRVFSPKGDIKESWKWLHMMIAQDTPDSLQYDEMLRYMIKQEEGLRDIGQLSPPADFTIAGNKIARESHRYSGRTAMHANAQVSEPKPPADKDSAFTYTMEGYHGKPPGSMIPFFWSPGWNSVQSLNKYQIEVGGPLHNGHPGVRIVQTDQKGKPAYYTPGKSKPAAGLKAVPVYHIFGSEELSSLSPAIKELSPEPYAGLSEKQAQLSEIVDGDPVRILNEDNDLTLPCKFIPNLPDDVVLIPAGLEGVYFDFGKSEVRLEKV